MCGRYILVQKIEVIEKRFNVSAPEDFDYRPGYNISPGQYAPVITNKDPRKLSLMQFGMTPFWAKKPMYLFNARAEGDHNRENDPGYKGARGIITKPAFRKPIRSQRCLVIADAFIEGTTRERLDKPYVVYLKEKERPFAFAGIWDEWLNQETGELVSSFSIITTVANELIRMIPHHRSPVILSRGAEKNWLRDDLPLADVTSLLHPYPAEDMNAYPIGKGIKDPRNDGRELIAPAGERLTPESGTRRSWDVNLQGMGTNKRIQDKGDFLEITASE